MGTNFFVEADPTCNNPEHTKTLHIGKSSAGWKFGFHGIPELGLTSWDAWQTFLERRTITDEYGRAYTLDEFKVWAERHSRPGDPPPPAIGWICRVEPTPEMINVGYSGRYSFDNGDYHDPQGYDFYDGEFS